jgi:hypothetical protein
MNRHFGATHITFILLDLDEKKGDGGLTAQQGQTRSRLTDLGLFGGGR